MENKRLGDYIREVNVRNRDLKVTNLLGVSISKEFMPSIANTIGTDMSTYKIEKKGWSLVPSKYIEFRNRDEQIDLDTNIKQMQAEMSDLLQQEEESKQQLKELFNSLGYGLE